MKRWRQWVKGLKTETYTIYLASKDPRVPWYAKALIIFVAGHTLSPIDLIPDFIPVIGYLDDLIITPLGIALALKLIPEDVLSECRVEAQKIIGPDQHTSSRALVTIIIIWLMVTIFMVLAIMQVIRN